MELHDINTINTFRRRRKRIGRGPGSGFGKMGGRGIKGHGARSGWSRRTVFTGEDIPLFRKMPIKGFNNNEFRTSYLPVNVEKLNIFDDGDTVTLTTMREMGVVRANARNTRLKVKLLGVGDCTKKLTVQVHGASKSAIQKIEAKGGTVEIIK